MTAYEVPQHVGDEGDPRRRSLVAVRWTLASALSLVLVVILSSLAAGAAVSAVRYLPLPANVISLTAGALLVCSYVVQVGVVIYAAHKLGTRFGPAVGLVPVRNAGAWALAAMGLAIAVRLLSGVYAVVLQQLNVQLPGENIDVTQLLPGGPVGWVAAFLLLVVVAPFAEEVVFRGVLLSSMRDRWGSGWAVVGSSLLFAAVHVNPYVALPIFVLALGLGYLFLRSRSIWVSMACHATFNAIGFVALIFSQVGR